MTVKSEELPYMHDQTAEVTMRDLPYDKEPDILVDGKPATDKDIASKGWDKEKHSLTFTAKHFTTFKAVAAAAPKATAPPTTVESKPPVQPVLWVAAGVAALGLALALTLWFVRRKRTLNKPVPVPPSPDDGSPPTQPGSNELPKQ